MGDRIQRIGYWTSSWKRWCQWDRYARKAKRRKSNWPGIPVPKPLKPGTPEYAEAAAKTLGERRD